MSQLATRLQAADRRWVGSWGQGLTDISVFGRRVENETIRVVIPTSLAGGPVRLRLSNAYGHEPLRVGAAHIALADTGAAFLPATGRQIAFSGQTGVTIPAGATIASDPADLALPAGGLLTVSLYLPNVTLLTSGNFSSAPIYHASGGDFTAAQSADFVLEAPREVAPGIILAPTLSLLAGVDVLSGAEGGSVVAFGSSITRDGRPSILAARLRAAGLDGLGVINQGIPGNRILYDGAGQAGMLFGRAGLRRFAGDALEQPGVRYILVMQGNDVTQPANEAPATELASAAEIIAGLSQYVVQAHAQHIRIIGGTVTAFGGYHTWSTQREETRQAVNSWIRAGNFDGVFDADAATRDPAAPERLLAAYDSGDGLHPNGDGLRAIAESVDLALFRD